MEWDQIVDLVTPYVVKIETPQGHGTGFLCLYNEDKSICGIATANHVVEHADNWKEPIRIVYQPSNQVIFLTDSERVIYPGSGDNDSAVLLMQVGNLKFPQELIPLLPSDSPLPIGADVGWLGYPGIVRNTICFFSGGVSARIESGHTYLIDGVAINGVSGGPVVYSTPTKGVQIVGAVSAYMANRATGDVLPGLAVAQDVSHFHAIAQHVRSLDDAKKIQAQEQIANPPEG
jgi:hypothetical protein